MDKKSIAAAFPFSAHVFLSYHPIPSRHLVRPFSFLRRHRPRHLFCRRPVTSGTLNRAGKRRRRSNTSLYRRLFVSGPSPAWDTPLGRRVIYVYPARVRPSAVTRIPRAVVHGNGRGSCWYRERGGGEVAQVTRVVYVYGLQYTYVP